ncbi:MAG TPA: metallophosphoesterase family protein [Thermoanaerobaculia bacterium]|jgi:predicted phosphodiesterase|nr:metallophosphoesterase family protein [Thermoanaerobaculia bacterium]
MPAGECRLRYLVISDMHGNCDAFDAVLRRVRRKRFDRSLVLGDLVGYGAGPNQVVEAVRGLAGEVHQVRGNHDKVVAGVEDGANFNPAALQAARWTTERLTAVNLRAIRELPQGPIAIDAKVAICHGSPLDEDAYVFSDFDAYQIFTAHEAPVTFFGHTHIPSLFVRHPGGIEVALLRGESGTIRIEEGFQYLLNPGSVGQPRDRDPRASYMTYDSDKRLVRWHRVEYPIARAQDRILKAGLPRVLADRLAAGI